MPIDYNALAQQAGAVSSQPAQIDYNALAKQAGSTSSAPARSGFGGFLDQIKEFAQEVPKQLNPVEMVKGTADLIRQAATHPIDTANAIAQKNEVALEQAKDAYHRGDYTSAAFHAFNYAMPFGSALNDQTNDVESGHVGRALAKALAFGVQMAAPGSEPVKALVGKIPEIRLAPRFTNPNPVEAEAVQFGRANDIPVSAGVATGNKFVQGAQAVVDHSPAGSIIAQRAKAAEGQAFQAVGDQLAGQVHATSIAPAQAGRDVTGSIEGTITAHNTEANAQYSTLREIEADPANLRNVQVGMKEIPYIDSKTGQTIPDKTRTVPDMRDVPLPVDLRPVKEALAPVYAQIARQLPITQMRASSGIKALENILHGPDAAPVSQVDMDLGTIKAAARGADLPELRTLSQGLAAKAVEQLHNAVTDAVGRAERSAPGAPAAAPVPQPQSAPAQTAPASAPAAAPAPTAAAPAAATPPEGPVQTRIPIPNSDRAYDAEYQIVDRRQVQASHNAQNFQPNPKYNLINDRDYSKSVNQGKIITNSTPERFDPAQIVNDNADATAGPTITDEAGMALGGNGRKMYIDRAYDADPGNGYGLKDRLIDRAAQFGATPEQVRAMDEPMLTRVVRDDQFKRPGYTKRDAIRDFNVPGTASLTPAEQAVSDARRVTQGTLDHIAGQIAEKGPDATLAQAIEGRGGVEIIRRLHADDVIQQGDFANLVTHDESALTDAGKERIAQLMTGRFFRDASQIESTAPAIKAKIERIAAPAASIEGEGAYSLTPTIKSAIDLLDATRAHGSATLDDYLDQSSLFARQRYSPEAIEMARQLKATNPLDLVNAVRKYGEAAKYAGDYEGPGMFGDLAEPKTPRAAFNEAFGTKIPESGEKAPAEPEQSKVPAKPAGFDDAFKPPSAPPEKPTAPPIGARVGTSAGKEALDALSAGRAATAAKYDAAGVLKSLPKSGEEGRQVFDQAIWSKDAGIEHLREVKRLAPDEIPKIGRAFLDELFGKASAEGGFKNGAALQAKWQNLGPETKEILYPNPLLRKDLDNFFLLAKKAGESPNPSGSALVGSVVAGVGYAFTNPATGVPMIIGSGAISKMLHSPAGIDALSRGLTVNVSNEAAATIAAARILKIAGAAAQPRSAYPMAAQAADPAQTAQPSLIASR